METIIFKVPDGTKARLKKIHPVLSELLRRQTEKMINGSTGFVSAHDKSRHLISKSGIPDLGTTKDYLKQYAKKHR